MRALIVSQYYWPEGFPINDIVKTMAQTGVEVEVLTGKPNYPQGRIYEHYRAWGCQREYHDGILVHRIPLLARGRGAVRLAMNYLSFVATGLLLAPWLLRKRQFDIVFVYAPSPILQALPALFLAWLKGCPSVLWVQDLWPESLSATGHVRNKTVLALVERVVRYIYRHMDLLLVQSEAFIAPVRQLAGGTPVVYHANSAAQAVLATGPAVTPSISGLGEGFSVMFAGNIGTAQAVDVIIVAAALLRDEAAIQFVVLGDGSRRAWMIEQVAALGLRNVHLPGRFPMEMMPHVMQKASVLLVTLADQEIFRLTVPSKIQAYLAAGRPILACLNGEGAKLVARAGAGLTVPAGDGPALAEAVLRLYRMSGQERDAMGANGGRYYAAHFSHDKLVARLNDLLRSCIVERKQQV